MSRHFSKKVALVTGAGSGIGEALVDALARNGARVIAADIDATKVEAVAARWPGLVRATVLDVADAIAWKRVVEDLLAQEGQIDFLFNNAGVGLAGELRDVTLADWQRLVDVNLWGVIHGIDAVYPLMLQRGSGHLVNTASGAALAPRPGMAAYAATKAAVVALSTSLRPEAQTLGVKVTVVCPGYIQTNIMQSTRYVKLDAARLAAQIPIKPMSAAKCAQRILRAVERNRAIEVIGLYPRLDWWLFRVAPALSIKLAQWRLSHFRRARN